MSDMNTKAHEVLWVARRPLPARVVEVRFYDPDTAVVNRGLIDEELTPYQAVRWHTDGKPAFEVIGKKNG